MLENSLKTLFDFQRFERSSALQSVINETLDRYSGKVIPLADDGIAMAAGGVGPEDKKSQVKPDDRFGIL
ncbi:MAG: hypothetical protein J6128_07415 [Clostridia bacterium]|jgi:hypothetical protein|nr:hypothetical protein [Clostridia bacterium]